MNRFERAFRELTRANDPIPFQDWVDFFSYGSNVYQLGLNETWPKNKEEIGAGFTGLVQGAYRRNGIVFACIQARLMLLSQARFQFQEMRQGQPGNLFGNASLSLLERPEPGKVTADLLARASVDVDIAGNHFLVRRATAGNLRLKRLRPDWVTIISGSPNADSEDETLDVDSEVIGYAYQSGGPASGNKPEFYLRAEVAHIAPIPDPLAKHRGMSWLTPSVRDIESDTSATLHKSRFFENAATPNIAVIRPDAPAKEVFQEWVQMIEDGHRGLANAYKTLYLTAGTDVQSIGANLQQIEFRATQGAGEVRIAADSGIHPVILGISEGLSGSSLNEGNFKAAKRLTADKALRPFWGNFASSMEVLIPPPSGARLWYDDRHIPFLAEDIKDTAEVQTQRASSIQILVNSGFKPDAVIDAVMADDYTRLSGQHIGLYSVQLQPPMPETPPAPSGNGVVEEDVADAVVGQEG